MTPQQAPFRFMRYRSHAMTGQFKAASFAGVALIHVVAATAPWFFSWQGLIAFFALLVATGQLGINLAFHRMLSHRSFRAPRIVERCLAVLGTLAHTDRADQLGGQPPLPPQGGGSAARPAHTLRGLRLGHISFGRSTATRNYPTPEIEHGTPQSWLPTRFIAISSAIFSP